MNETIKKDLNYEPGDSVVNAWAEVITMTVASGGSWSNSVVWVLIRNKAGNYRVECIQSLHRTQAMLLTYDVSRITSTAMTNIVRGEVCQSAE